MNDKGRAIFNFGPDERFTAGAVSLAGASGRSKRG